MSNKMYDHNSINLFPEGLTITLPDGYRIDVDYDDEGGEIVQLRGDFSFDEEGEEVAGFTGSFIILNSEVNDRAKAVEEGTLKESFVPGLMLKQVADGVFDNLEEQVGPGKRFDMLESSPASTVMKFYKPISIFGVNIESFIVIFVVEISEQKHFGFQTVYQNNEDENTNFFKNLLDVMKSFRVNGESVNLGHLTPKKLEQVLDMDTNVDVEALDLGMSVGINLQNGDEETQYTINSDGSITDSDGKEIQPYDSGKNESIFNFFTSSEEIKEIKVSDDDSGTIIVDNAWSFTLPEGLEFKTDAPHRDIMGNESTAQYLVEGLPYNGTYLFDFELHERWDYGIGADLDVIGCRYDNDVLSGNAQQNVIRDDDNLYVDIVVKPIFFSRSTVQIRVRGNNLKSWDFVMGVDGNDEDVSSKWESIKELYIKLAESIRSVNSDEETEKNLSTKNAESSANPDFIITDGVLRKYIGKKNDIVIPDGVVEVSDSAFSGLAKLKTVVVPEGVKRIGQRCFENCTGLKNCYLPESLEEIGGYAFVDCHELKEIYLSEKIKKLGGSAFSECFVLRDVKIPAKIKAIDAFTFKNCVEFKHIVIPEGVESVGVAAFAGCKNLEYLFIPSSVKSIEVDFMNNSPFQGSELLTIYTPKGSFAQKFAEDNEIPFENTDKGVVVADNAKARSDSADAEAKRGKSIITDDGLVYINPDEALYPHYSSKHAPQGLSILGIKVISNQSGTDYQFFVLPDDIGDDASEEFKCAVSKLSDTGASSYKLANRAAEMRSVFHVSPDIFDFRHDRECELAEGLMQRAYMMSALRSYAWTISKYCDEHKTTPGNLSLEQIQNIVEFIANRDWLNYNGVSYCKSLCGTQDLHVYYLPDNTDESVKTAFETSNQELEDARKLKESFPSYNPIFTQIGSLDGIRKDLEYIYPSIETLYEDIKKNRDINEPLTGNNEDILYAWCALAYAARAPFFTEDGPSMYMYSQIENEEEIQKKKEDQIRRVVEERAKTSKKFLEVYGDYFEKNPTISFKEKKFVFTGLGSRVYWLGDDTDYTKLIEERGGLTRSKVSGVTDYLVIDPAEAGDSAISTAIENQKKGKPTKIILLDDLRNALGLPTDEGVIPVKKLEGSTSSEPAATTAFTSGKQAHLNSLNKINEHTESKRVTVDNTWTAIIPDGFKYSTDKSRIGGHRNIIIIEDKAGNAFEDSFNASISFTSQFNESQGNPAPVMAKIMSGFVANGLADSNINVITDEEDLYVSTYFFNSDDSGGVKSDIYKIDIGCGSGVSSIQVFFNNSDLSKREQTKIVESFAKSVRLAGDDASQTDTSSVLTPEQQRQKDDLNRQIEDLRSQAALYSNQQLSSEDRKTLDDAKAGIKELEGQLSSIESDQEKFGEFLRRKEEREKKQEEERKRKIEEAIAAGRSVDDEENMFVILHNEEKAKQYRNTQKEFYDTYKDYFPAFKSKELRNLRKEVETKIKDKNEKKNYADCFMKRSVRDRFDVVTDAYFSFDEYADYSLRAEDAVIKTAEWYSSDEMPEVRRMMKEVLENNRKQIDDAFDPVETKWKKFESAKEFLKIVVRDGDSEEVRNDCRLFQTKVSNNYLTDPLIIEVSLSTKGMLQLSTPVMNIFPYYWGASVDEIWDTAEKNEIKDESTAYIDDIDDIVRNAFKAIKEGNPDTKTTLRLWESEATESAKSFTDYLSSLYEDLEMHCTDADIKENLKKSYKTESEFAERKEKLYETAKKCNLTCLCELLEKKNDIKDLYDSIPKNLALDIKTTRESKESEINEKKYGEATVLLNSNALSDLIMAKGMLEELGSYKDSNDLLRQTAHFIETKQSTQYEEAVSLREEGTEESVSKAIDKLDELGEYRDAANTVKEYRDFLGKERIYKQVRGDIDSNNLDVLRNARSKLEELKGFKKADELLTICNSRIESIMTDMYDEAMTLADKQTEESLTEAKAILSRITSFRDSEEKSDVVNKLLTNEIIYKEAASLASKSDLTAIQKAKEQFTSLSGYKDADEKATECEKQIEMICKYLYVKASEAERTITTESQEEAISLYEQLKGWDDTEERIKKCRNNINAISQIETIKKQIKSDEEELANLKGTFKKKDRKIVEERKREAEQKASEMEKMLYGSGIGEKANDEVPSSLARKEFANHIESSKGGDISKPVIAVEASRKKGKGIWIIIGVLIAALITAALFFTGVLYISPDAEECVVEGYGSADNDSIFIENYKGGVDSENNIYVLYKITNTSGDDIWNLYGDVIYQDVNGKDLCNSGISYRGLLKPGKSVFLITSSYDVKASKIARVKMKYYDYCIGQVRYTVDTSTKRTEKGASEYENYNNADYEKMNCLSFDINNRGVDEYDEYYVDVKVKNNGSSPVNRISYNIDYLDADSNILYSGVGYIEKSVASSAEMLSEASYYEQIEGDGSTKQVKSTVITGYSYYLDKDDENGNNYYTIDLVNKISRGDHYDD